MNYNIISTKKKSNYFIDFLKKESVLVIALTLAIISSFISIPKISYIDFKVLILLFNLMIVVAAFKELKVLDIIAIALLKKCSNSKSISLALIGITFISSMLVTNDVALITFVPISIIISKKVNIDALKIVIFQTLAANLGSSFTPMGNPQNLFIYSFYNINTVDFFKITLPIIVLSIVFLSFLIIKQEKVNLHLNLEEIKCPNKSSVILYSILFFIILLSVFHVIDYRLTFMITILVVFFTNKKLFTCVDYSLLLTFISFFIFVGNVSTLDYVSSFIEGVLNSKKSTFISSILTSQLISNVPATMLLSNFTSHYKELLLGVNVGGMGTLIASLASVISYKIYTTEFSKSKYLSTFTFYNLIGLIIFIPFIFIMI